MKSRKWKKPPLDSTRSLIKEELTASRGKKRIAENAESLLKTTYDFI